MVVRPVGLGARPVGLERAP